MIQLSRGESLDTIIHFNPATFLCLLQAMTYTSQRHMSWSLKELRSEVIGRFVDIVGFVDLTV